MLSNRRKRSPLWTAWFPTRFDQARLSGTFMRICIPPPPDRQGGGVAEASRQDVPPPKATARETAKSRQPYFAAAGKPKTRRISRQRGIIPRGAL